MQAVVRAFEPGGRWSSDVRPLIGTDSCPGLHVGYVLSGRLHVRLHDDSTLDLEPGEVFDDPCRLLDRGGEVRMRP